MEPQRFTAAVRRWNPETAGGLAVVDVPPEVAVALGGLRQQRVRGRIGGAEFTSSVMPAGGGRLALSCSKAMLAAAGLGIGDEAAIELLAVGREA
jgi:hypothetical protein